MQFISIKEIASTDVEVVSSDTTLLSAINYMLSGDHRNVVVTDKEEYLILSIQDILSIHYNKIDLNLPISILLLRKLPKIDKNSDIVEALASFDYSLEHFVVINKDGSLYGLVAHSDIISSIDPNTLMESYKILDLVKAQESHISVPKNEVTANVFKLLQDNSNNAIIIIEDKKPLGIITTKDVLRLLQTDCDLSCPIEHYMISPVSTLDYHSTIKEALNYIKERHFKQIVTIDSKGNFFAAITQKNLISINYSRWITIMKQHHKELNDINMILKKKNTQYEKLASIDSLTGLYNRMKFMELYISEYMIMTQRDNDMVIMLIDLDYFKNINDTYGHNIGDQVLIEVSNIFRKLLRTIDISCRWGGEEFVILLPSTNLHDGYLVAENIRIAIENIHDSILPKVTASFGMTKVLIGDTLNSSIARADKAMYTAKSTGRNSIKVL